MKVLALVLALAVGTNALQPGLEYQYRYKARVATGVTQVNRQFAAAGIQGDVTIQVTDDYTTYFKFSNVEVGEMNEHVDCDLRKPLPMEYHPIQAEKDLLETPFRITTNGSQYPEYMESPEEPVWVSNIRKSVVNIFRIAPLWDHTGKVQQLNFGVEEETLIGRCMNWYTSMKYPEHMADKFSFHREEYMEEDVQRGHKESRFRPNKDVAAGSSSVPLEDSLWWVTRNTDFDDCHDFAEMRIHGTDESEDVMSRSSVGKYVIRGDEHRRLEQAVVEGTIAIYTNHEETDVDSTFDDAQRYGYMNTFRDHERYDHIDTFTNQTIELRAVREISSPISIDYTPHHHHSWNYDIENTEDNHYTPMEQLITGRPIDNDLQSKIMDYIRNLIEEMSHWMENQPHHHDNMFVNRYTRLIEAVNTLDYDHIKDLHTEFYANGADNIKLYFFHQAIIYSGSMDAIRFGLEKLKDSNFDDHFHMKTLFYDVMDHTVQHPDSINRIMEYLMNEEDSETHNFGLMSFSSLVHDMCLSQDRKDFYYDYYHDSYGHCDQDHIIKDYMPYLENGMKNKNLPIWRRLMYLQALSNLGTPQTINLLKPYMVGAAEENDVFVRTNAIWSLNWYNMHDTAESYVFNILMPIMENKREDFEIRSMAFLTMASWRPSLSWWKRMAVMTWYDPSPQFTNFVYSTIDSIAHSNTPRNETLARVLHLCKPSSPPSVLHSTNMFLYEYLFSEEMGTHVNFAWFAGVHGFFPEEVFMRLRQEVFYGYRHVYKFDVQQRGFDMLWHKFNEIMYGGQVEKSGAQDMVHGMWNEIKEKLGVETPSDPATFSLWAKFDRLVFLANEFHINENFMQEFSEMEFLKHMALTWDHPHYFRKLRSFFAVPTEVGLPFSVQYSDNNALWFEAKQVTDPSFNDNKFKGSMEFTIDLSRQAYVEVRTHLPWSQEHPAIHAGLYGEWEVVLPFKCHATFDIKHFEFNFGFEPIKNEKFDVFNYHLYPYTVLGNNYPIEVIFKENDYKHVNHDDKPLFEYRDQALPSNLGFWLENYMEGDEYYYYNFRNFLKEFRTTLHLNTWEHRLTYDPSASSTKSVDFTFNYLFTGEHTSNTDLTENMQRISEMQQKYKSSGGNVRTISVEFDLHGSSEKTYGTSFTWSRGHDHKHFNSKMHFTLRRDNHYTCVNAQVQKPYFDKFAFMKEVFDADYHSTVKAEFYDGENCDGTPVMEVKGTFDVSDDAKNRVRKYVDEHCEYNSYSPEIDIITSPEYDHVHFKANWNDNTPDRLINVTNFVYDYVRGFRCDKMDFDYTHENNHHEFELDASRNLETKHWTVRAVSPHEIVIMHDWNMPMWMDVMTSPAPVDTTFLYDFCNGRFPSSCRIDDHHVRTFDGYEYEFQPDECWTTMAIDVSQKETGALMVRKGANWEAKIIWESAGIVFDITPSNFMMNGEAYNGHDERFTVHHYDDDSHTLEFSSGTTIRVSDKVELLMSYHSRGHIQGICGNYNGEPMDDLIGPKHCYYTDYRMFHQAWMTPMEGGCGDYDAKIGAVHGYQGSCPKDDDVYEPTGETYREGMVDCTEWEYHERDEEDYHCTSLQPIPKCKSGCYAKYPRSEDMEYECRYKGHQGQSTPHTKEESYSHTYYLTYPAKCIHE